MADIRIRLASALAVASLAFGCAGTSAPSAESIGSKAAQDSTQQPASIRGGALIRLADEARLRGDYVTAKNRYERVLGFDPHAAPALVGMGRIALAEGDLDSAAAAFERAAAAAPDLDAPWLALAEGQARLLCARQPIPQVLADRDAPEPLRDSLSLVLRARDFARELGFEVDGLYSQYADWPGDQIVTHVVATRSGEVEAIGFWFPIVGRVPYRGYFDAEAAAGEATRLREEGYDVCLTPVRAYSTLGWFSDPVTGPMLRQPQAQLVETIFHELVHANLFLRDQATFNESAATFLGEEARVAFYAREQGPAGAVRERDRVAENRRFRAEIERARQEVSQLYAEQPPSLERRAARRAGRPPFRSPSAPRADPRRPCADRTGAGRAPAARPRRPAAALYPQNFLADRCQWLRAGSARGRGG